MAICTKCKQLKSEDQFYKTRGECKDCIKDNYRTIPKLIKTMYNSQVYCSKQRGMNMEMTREEFFAWVMYQPNFNTLFQEWEKSKWSKNLRPSVDRIDDYDTYNVFNIRLTTWEDNHRKAADFRKLGINGKANHRVKINGVEYPSKNAAARALGIHGATITRMLNGHNVRCFDNYTAERVY